VDWGGEKISKPVDCTREGGDRQVGRVGRAGPHNSGIERGRRQRVRSGRFCGSGWFDGSSPRRNKGFDFL
jgi:hypothetical protein